MVERFCRNLLPVPTSNRPGPGSLPTSSSRPPHPQIGPFLLSTEPTEGKQGAWPEPLHPTRLCAWGRSAPPAQGASQVHNQDPTLWTRKGLLSPKRGPTTSGSSPTNTEKHRNRYTIKKKKTIQGETHTQNRHMQMHTHPHRYPQIHSWEANTHSHISQTHTRRKAP